jgi:hypothetical protein
MKKNILIIIFLIAAQLGAFSLVAQERSDTVLLADETTLNYNKTEAVIKCSNETIFNELFKTHGTLFKRFTCTWKTDRHGRYKYYVAYLQKDDAAIIVKWAKTNL